jgi:hypothetical protein
MPREKEIFPRAISGTLAKGSSAPPYITVSREYGQL